MSGKFLWNTPDFSVTNSSIESSVCIICFLSAVSLLTYFILSKVKSLQYCIQCGIKFHTDIIINNFYLSFSFVFYCFSLRQKLTNPILNLQINFCTLFLLKLLILDFRLEIRNSWNSQFSYFNFPISLPLAISNFIAQLLYYLNNINNNKLLKFFGNETNISSIVEFHIRVNDCALFYVW